MDDIGVVTNLADSTPPPCIKHIKIQMGEMRVEIEDLASRIQPFEDSSAASTAIQDLRAFSKELQNVIENMNANSDGSDCLTLASMSVKYTCLKDLGEKFVPTSPLTTFQGSDQSDQSADDKAAEDLKSARSLSTPLGKKLRQ